MTSEPSQPSSKTFDFSRFIKVENKHSSSTSKLVEIEDLSLVTLKLTTSTINYMNALTTEGMNSEEIALELLKDGVLCSPGSAFGPSGEGHLRFAYTISKEDIQLGMDKVELSLKRLNGL